MPDEKRIFEKKIPYTIVRNEVFDEVMPKLSLTAWKVLCAIIRATMGWQKTEDQLSYSQLLKKTGLGSPSSITRAISELETGGYVETIRREHQTNLYRLNEDYILILGTTPDVVPEGRGTTLDIVPPTTPDVVGVLHEVKTQNKPSKESTTVLTDGKRKVPDTPHHQVVAGYVERIAKGYSKRHKGKFAADMKAIKAMLERGHSPETILACYDDRKAGWWSDKHLPMRRLDEDIDDWVKHGTHKRGDQEPEIGPYQAAALRRMEEADAAE